MVVFLYVLLCLLPAVMVELAARGMRRWSTDDRPAKTAKRGCRPPRSCDRYRSDLRRLSDTYDRLQSAEVPARATRLRAVEMAYDDTLRAACVAFELDRPPDELDAVTRLQVEADLLTAGLRW